MKIFNSHYDIGHEGYIVNIDTFKINKIRIGEIRVCNITYSEEYGYELLKDTKYGFIEGKYSYKPFDSLYSGSYSTHHIKANDIFDSLVDVKLAIRNYVEERARLNIHKKLDIINPILKTTCCETTIPVNLSIGDTIFVEDSFGSEIISATISDYMLIKQKCTTKLIYVLYKSNGTIGYYEEDKIFLSKDKIFNKRANEYFNKFIIN